MVDDVKRFKGIITNKFPRYWKNGKGTTYIIVSDDKEFATFSNTIYEDVEIGEETEFTYNEKQNGQYLNRNILELSVSKEGIRYEDYYKKFSGKTLTKLDKFDEIVEEKIVSEQTQEKLEKEYEKIDEDYRGLSFYEQKKKRIIDNYLNPNFEIDKELDYFTWEIHVEFLKRAIDLGLKQEEINILGKSIN